MLLAAKSESALKDEVPVGWASADKDLWPVEYWLADESDGWRDCLAEDGNTVPRTLLFCLAFTGGWLVRPTQTFWYI